MIVFRLAASLALALGLSACASVDTTTRNAHIGSMIDHAVPVSLDIQDVRVTVPKSLKVSEANRYLPGGDIVWREDPPGDRHAQVKAIVETALQTGVSQMPEGGIPAILDVTVTRFHALSEKARYTVGGVHAVQFEYVLRNPATGEAYGAPKFVKADFNALGGQAAISAEQRGITQKVRISGHLANVIRTELERPDGYHAEALGLIGALNQI